MIKVYCKLCLVLFFLLQTTVLPQWSSLQGPCGTNQISTGSCVNKNNLFISAGSTISYSSDMGESWDVVGQEFPNDIKYITASENTMFVIAHGLLYKCTNVKKQVYDRVPLPLEDGVLSLALQDSILFIGTTKGVYKSADRAETFMRIERLKDTGVYSIGISGDRVLASTQYGVYYSTDLGDSWNIKKNVVGDKVVTVGNGLIYMMNSWKIIRSTDNGVTWIDVSKMNVNINAFFAEKDIAIVAYDEGVFYSTDRGKTWTTIRASGKNVKVLGVLNAKIYIGVLSEGVFLWDEIEKKWKNIGLWDAGILNVATNKDYLFAFCGVNFYRRHKNESAWKKLESIGEMFQPAVLVTNDYILIYDLLLKGTYKSTDNGDSWVKVNVNKGIFFRFKSFGREIYTLTTSQIWLSTDDGSTWQLRSNLDGNVYDCDINGKSIIVSTDMGIMYFEESIQNWKSTWKGPVGRIFRFSNVLLVVSTRLGLIRSNDEGRTWTKIEIGDSNMRVVEVAESNGVLMLVSEKHGVLYSKDKGQSWSLLFEKIDGVRNLSAFADEYKLYIGTTKLGMIYSSLKNTPVITNDKEYNADVVDSMCVFPNPVNDELEIHLGKFTSSEHYRITDFLGTEMLSGEVSTNEHFDRINVSALPNGVYILSVVVRGEVYNEKFVIAR